MPVELLDFEPRVFPPLSGETPLTALQEEILELKRSRNAVILAHNYQIEPIQRISDYLGDSLGLAYAARETDADVILFCGVHFRAEPRKSLIREKPSFSRMRMRGARFLIRARLTSWNPGRRRIPTSTRSRTSIARRP